MILGARKDVLGNEVNIANREQDGELLTLLVELRSVVFPMPSLSHKGKFLTSRYSEARERRSLAIQRDG